MLTETFIKRPIMATMIIMAMVVLGIFSFLELGVDLMPKVEFPIVVVTTDLLGANPEEMETEVTKKIEESINTVAGLDELSSNSFEGRSQVVAQFVLEKDGDVAAQEVRDRVNRVVNDLPAGTKMPVVEKFDIGGAPIVQVIVSGNLPIRDLTKLTRKKVKEILETVNGVGDIKMIGQREREIHVQIDPAKLAAKNLSIFDVQTALQKENIELPGGFITEEPRELVVRTMGKIVDSKDFGAIPIETYKNIPIFIRDIATIEDTNAEQRSFSRYDGEPCISLPIRKQSDANTVDVAEKIQEKIKEIRKTLPAGVTIQTIQDQSRFILSAVRSLEEDVVLGAILVSLTVFLFIRNFRGMLICAVSIPASLISTFTLVKALGFTLNNLTLLALSLATGIVIDDAIIVMENIFRHMEEKNESRMQAAANGLREIAPAVVSTTLSLMVIFVPLAFMQGIVGRFMYSFGLTMAFAIGVSLVVALILTPMLCARFLHVKKTSSQTHTVKTSRDNLINRMMDTYYTRMLKQTLAHRKTAIFCAILIMLSSIPSLIFVGKDFMARDDRSEFSVHIKAPEGTSIDAMGKTMFAIEEKIKQVKGVTNSLISVGSGENKAVNEGDIYVKLKGLKERNFSQKFVMNQIRELLTEYPTLRTSVMDVGGGGGSEAMFQVKLTGPDLAKLREYADKITSSMRKKKGFVDIDTSLVFGKPEIRINIDRQRSADLGVTANDISRAIQLFISGTLDITKFKVLDELYEVRIRLEEKFRKRPEALLNLPIPSTKEHKPEDPVRLDQVMTLSETTGPSQIERFMRQRSIQINANLNGLATDEAKKFVLDEQKKIRMEPGYVFEFTGLAKYMKEMQVSFTMAFLLSFIFMYMILASLFESWIHPITILCSLPLAFPFAIFSLLITGETLHIISILGMFLLIGIVKKNSILQVDYTNTLRSRGMPRHEALIEASRTRLRPILMTTITLIAGMIPVALARGEGSATRAPMAVVIIGGQSLCLLVTLLLTPVFYSVLDDLQSVWIPRWIGNLRSRLSFLPILEKRFTIMKNELINNIKNFLRKD